MLHNVVFLEQGEALHHIFSGILCAVSNYNRQFIHWRKAASILKVVSKYYKCFYNTVVQMMFFSKKGVVSGVYTVWFEERSLYVICKCEG